MPRLLDRYVLFYPMRVVGASFLILIIFLQSRQVGGLDPFEWLLIGYLLVHPHLVYLLVRRYGYNRERIERVAFLVDAFLIGLVVQLTSFSPLPSLILVTVVLVNGLAINGFRQMGISALALLLGIAVGAAFGGFAPASEKSVGVDVACSVFLFVYFNFFAYSAYNRSALLEESQRALREQKATLEIEKARSDRLRLNLVPAELAKELERDGKVRPSEFDPVTLVAVEICDLAATLEQHGIEEALAHLSHCFQAFDAISDRFGLERIKALGGLFLAVAGLPRLEPDHAMRALCAGIEMRDFLADLQASRRAHQQFAFQARIGVHSGRVVGGLVQSSKLGYEVWGRAVTTVLRLTPLASAGQVVMSDATRELVEELVSSTPAGSIVTGAGVEQPFFEVGGLAA
jgi:class 3 adenylate cyclase